MQRDFGRLIGAPFDVLVVGGGVHGAWLALRAARAGWRTALVEERDFASGTSANSLRILHGGLRYLQHLDLPRVLASVAARRQFSRQSPHLVRPLPCLMPLAHQGLRSPWVFGPALLVNDVLTCWQNIGVSAASRIPRGELISGAGAQMEMRELVESAAVAGGVWWDALALDPARLVLETLLEADQAGAVVINHASVAGLLLAGENVAGVAVRDCLGGTSAEVQARCVVDCTGPAVGSLAMRAGLAARYRPRAWVGALNVVLKRDFGLQRAVALSSRSRGADGSAVLRRAHRELFFVPDSGLTMVGTDYVEARPEDARRGAPPDGAVERFVAEICAVAPVSKVQLGDVVAVHWGVLPAAQVGDPLPARKAVLAAGRSETGARGLVAVVSEKLTSAPELSRRVLSLVERELATSRPAVRRAERSGSGEQGGGPLDGGGSVAATVQARLASRYGRRWHEVLASGGRHGVHGAPIVEGGEILAAEVVHAVACEAAMTLEDVVLRRLGLSHPGALDRRLLEAVASIMSRQLEWSPARIDDEVNSMVASPDRRLGFAL